MKEDGVKDHQVLEGHLLDGINEVLAGHHDDNLSHLTGADQMIEPEVLGIDLQLQRAIQMQIGGRESHHHLEEDHQFALLQGKVRAPGDLRGQRRLLPVPEMKVIAGKEKLLKMLVAGKGHLDEALNPLNSRMMKAGKSRVEAPTGSVLRIDGKEVDLQGDHLPEITFVLQMSLQEDVVHLQGEILPSVLVGDMSHLVHEIQIKVEVQVTSLQEGMTGKMIDEIVLQPDSHTRAGISRLEMVPQGIMIEEAVGATCRQVADQMHHPVRGIVIKHGGSNTVDIVWNLYFD